MCRVGAHASASPARTAPRLPDCRTAYRRRYDKQISLDRTATLVLGVGCSVFGRRQLLVAGLIVAVAASTGRTQTDDKVPLPIKLPKPVFAGTSANLTAEQMARIEKPTGKPRP